ncbi:MAG: sigma 54-interacting transcriptional regulator, partial [Polyangiales bacterium]
ELFGHEKGAFTGADRQRAGAFELADGGTIFLDEIGELPLHLQPKLLRALERREVKRLGASRSLDVDVRVVAATHRDLLQMVAQGEFREDLYYRLAEVVVALPPLRERREDVPLLARRIMQAHAPRGCKVQHIEDSAMQALQMRDWLGNVRELRNVLRRALALSSGPTLRAADVGRLLTRPSRLPPAPGGGDATGSTEVGEHLPIKEARERWLGPLEREYLTRVVRDSAGNLDRAAERAGIHRKSLERLLRQHGLKVAELRASPMPSQEKSR